jgi:polyisoprenyl-teichoic acid--peptidoglycan teichoic acid transferase
MTIRRSVAVCAGLIAAGMLLCGAAVTQLDMPSRSPIDESYDPQAPLPPGYVITTPDPNATVDDSENGPAPSMDAVPSPDASQVAQAAASSTPVGPAPTSVPTVALPPLPNTINIILLGSDHRNQDTDWRTDTMILVMLDPRSKQAGVINIPRDLWVNIPGRAPNRINTLDEFGGPPLVKQVVGSVLGVPIDYYVRIDFSGFQKAIDTIGGITVDVDCTLRESNIVFPAGKTQMDGATALLFSRLRKSTSIFDRMRRQSRVLWAVREKLLSADMFPRIPELWNVIRTTVQTDIPPQDMLSLASLANEIKPSDIRGLMIDYSMSRHATSSQGWWILLPDLNHIRTASRSVFNTASPTLIDAVTKKPGTCA